MSPQPNARGVEIAAVIADVRARLLGADSAVPEADALLADAQQLLSTAAAKIAQARAALPQRPQAAPIPDTDEGTDLSRFSWTAASGKISDPSGLPQGAAFGVGVEGGKRYFQWHWPRLILHAVGPAASDTATGDTLAWYHFTDAAQDNGQPHPAFAAGYAWRQTGVAREKKTGILWRRWAGAGAKA